MAITFTISRDALPAAYASVLTQNPLLARAEGEMRSHQWTELEIRTIQLLTACRSNASLTQRLKELEESLAKYNGE